MIKIRDFLYMDETGTNIPLGKKVWMYQGLNTETQKMVDIYVDTETKPDEDFDKKIRERITIELTKDTK